ncbi:MAG: zeta toxin family protein [Clostridiaceae bacterium]|nr:zeta toxin family protein [Clostridiaceae bacterium]
MFCPNCHADLLMNHLLDDRNIPPMTNRSKILYPQCSSCGHVIQLADIAEHIQENKKVLLITGTAGAGKTAIGQMIENKSDYIFIDGDAVQKRVNYFVKRDPRIQADYQGETIRTMLILLGLGYPVVVGYIINRETLERYQTELAKYKITPVFRVLVPERNICLERDIARDCWTAGAKWVDQWYDEMRSFLVTHPELCIDNSHETLEETFNHHFAALLN